MGLWYTKDTAMTLTAYANADHAGYQDTRRSTSGSAQFLGDKLVSWSLKKHKSTAISTTEAEYVAMSGCTLTYWKEQPSHGSLKDAEQSYLSYLSRHSDTKTGVFSFQLDEFWFNLNANLLRNALGISPKDSAHPFVPHPAGDLVIDFVNNLDKTSSSDRPVLQMLWGVVMGTNVDYAKLIWEEFIQTIKNFFSDMANLKVPTKLIIYYLGVDMIFIEGPSLLFTSRQITIHSTILNSSAKEE
ncbi:hypothetical protein Tco_0592531 [Tanacetum coccineum]